MGGSHRVSHRPGTAASWTDISAVLPPAIVNVEATGIATDGACALVTGHGFNGITYRDKAQFWTRSNPPPCPADINGDHSVGTIDLTNLLGYFGQAVPPGMLGDPNHDGIVNSVDLPALLGSFHQWRP